MATVLACASADEASVTDTLDAGDDGVHPLFELSAAPMRFGAIPWPDDLYLDADGRIALAALPGEVTEEYGEALIDALHDLDGFGVASPVFFSFDGEIDPASLPSDTPASLEPSASVFLVDADPSSPSAFQRVPVVVAWDEAALRLSLRPAPGYALVPGRRYAAVVTKRVTDARGEPIRAAERFVIVRDVDESVDEAVVLAARAGYAPVLETLERGGLARTQIAGLAVFRVQSVRRDLEDARTAVRAFGATPMFTHVITGTQLDELLGQPLEPAVGVGLDGGVLHDAIGAVVQGTLPSPNFLSASDATHGAFERDEAGTLRIKRTEGVPFSLFLPRIGKSEPLPVVIYQHGRGRERSDALAVANVLSSVGIAVIAIDAPFHGLRAKGTDVVNRFTGAETPDGFGDVPDDFEGVHDAEGDLVPFHPFYVRDAMRQGVVDLMGVVRMIESGQLGELLAGVSQLARYRDLDGQRIGFIGMDLGGQLGVMLASAEPSVDAVVLAFSSGGVVDALPLSAAHQELFDQLASKLGRTAPSESDSAWHWPELAVVQTLVDRADPFAYVAGLRRSSTQVLMLTADEDEHVPNVLSEALAFSLGASLVSGAPKHVPGIGSLEIGVGEALSGNFVIEDDTTTRALAAYAKATHDALIHAHGTQRFAHPVEPPFEALEMPRVIENPTADLHTQVGAFFTSFYACPVASRTPARSNTSCAAAVYVP